MVAGRDITKRKEAEEKVRESEERFRAPVKASSDVVYRMSPDWTEMRHLVGRDLIADTEEPTRAWLQKYIHPDDQPHVLAVINEAIRTRSVFQLEHRVLRVDGSLGWTFSRAIPILDATGEITDWFGMASDVTERKQAEAELARTTVLLETLLASAPQGFCYFDRDLRYVRINERLAEMNGIPAEDHIGKTVADIVPSLLPAAQAVTARILATGEAMVGHEFSGETPLQPGVARYWSESWYPVRDDAGAITGFGVIVEEITARKQAEAALRESMAELERFNQRMVGRELRMVELKREVNALCVRLGQPTAYPAELVRELAALNNEQETEQQA